MDHHHNHKNKNKQVVEYCSKDVARPAGSSRHVHGGSGVHLTTFDFDELAKALRPVGDGHHHHHHGHQVGHHGHHHHEHQVGHHHGHHHHEHQVGHHGHHHHGHQEGHHGHHHHGHFEMRETTIDPRTGVVHSKETVVDTTVDSDDDDDC